MLPLRLFELFLGLLQLHSQELNLLVPHRNILLRVVCHLHLRFETLFHLSFKLFDKSLLRLELRFALLEPMGEHDFVVLLLLALRRCDFFQLSLALGKLDS